MRSTAKRKPTTLQDIEDGLDLVARRMAAVGPKQAELYLPIWRALTREQAQRVEAKSLLAAAAERFKQSKDRTEARSS